MDSAKWFGSARRGRFADVRWDFSAIFDCKTAQAVIPAIGKWIPLSAQPPSQRKNSFIRYPFHPPPSPPPAQGDGYPLSQYHHCYS